jgi:hypothetical protein
MEVVGTVESPVATDESWKRPRNSKRKKERASERDSNDPDLTPWWERIQAPESSARNENVHFSLTQRRRRSQFSPEAAAAADILLMMAQDSRELSITGTCEGVDKICITSSK